MSRMVASRLVKKYFNKDVFSNVAEFLEQLLSQKTQNSCILKTFSETVNSATLPESSQFNFTYSNRQQSQTKDL